MNSEHVQVEAQAPAQETGAAAGDTAEGDLSPQLRRAVTTTPESHSITARPNHSASAGPLHAVPNPRSGQGAVTRRLGQPVASSETGDRIVVRDRRESILAFKFGGTSLLGAGRMLHAARLVRPVAQFSRVVVVVSAMKGITDRLLGVARLLAVGKRRRAQAEVEGILRFHRSVLVELGLEVREHDRVAYQVDSLGRDLLYEVRAGDRVATTPEFFDRLASFGERLSARLFAATLERCGVAAVPVASSEFVLTCDTFGDAKPQLEQSKRRGREILLPLLEDAIVPVVTGFIGATPDGRITTLGRNSSDYSGAIVAHVVDADELVIWTDVDGIYTANPHESAEAKLLHDLSYDEAHALALSGAKVLHPYVLPLAAESKMTVWVRNTFKPEARGTRIGFSRRSKHLSLQGQQEGAA
jgi:bifunctional aspartokinase / homoserine dehydrogenase 1